MSEITLLIIMMALVTFIPRALPIVMLSRRRLPRLVELWLSYVPVAVLAALLTPGLFAPAGEITFNVSDNPYFWVSIPLFIIAYFTRSLFITVSSGMILISMLRYFYL